MIITSKKHAEGIIVGFSIRATGREDAHVKVTLDGGIITYQGKANEIAKRVTSMDAKTIKGMDIEVSMTPGA